MAGATMQCTACNSTGECQECDGRGWGWETNRSGETDRIPCEWCEGSGRCNTCKGKGGTEFTVGEEESFDQLIAEAAAIITRWNDWYTMPTDIDLICAAFDVIDATLDAYVTIPSPADGIGYIAAAYDGMRYVPHSIARHMADELWSSRFLR